MRNLAEFLQKYHHWIVFLILEVISAVLLFRFNSYQGSVWFTSANFISGNVYEASSAIEQYFTLTQANADLTKRNIELEKQVSDLTAQLDKESGDSALSHYTKQAALSQYKMIAAHVISNSIDKTDNLITIDKGTADGVRPDMGVVCGTGVVGIVYQSSPKYSIVIPVLSSQSNISCMIAGRRYFGYLHWTGGSSKIAYVDDIPRHATFKLPSDIVTSGYSSVFPPGIMVGKILHVYNSPDGLSYRLKIELSTNFSTLRDVCVIDDKVMRERLEVLRAAEDSLKIKKE